MKSLKLYHGATLIGTITNYTVEDLFQWSGEIELTLEGVEYQHVFDSLADDEAMMEGSDLPFDESYLEGWYIEDDAGEKTEIAAPTVNADGEVFWRDK